jgi:hypothetical protein
VPTFPLSRRASSLLLIPVLVVAFAGCGGGDDNSTTTGTPSEQITAVAKNYVGDIHDKKWKDVCNAFSKAAMAQVNTLVQSLQAPGCPEALATTLSQPGNNALEKADKNSVKVTNVKVNGDHATAIVTPSADKDPTTYFVNENGVWKIDADPASQTGTVTTKGPSSGSTTKTGTTTSGG